MAQVTHREPRPGETCFGGKGILIPFRLDQTASSAAPSSSAEVQPKSNAAFDPMQPVADAIEAFLRKSARDQGITDPNMGSDLPIPSKR
jgi:hypothetical protein